MFRTLSVAIASATASAALVTCLWPAAPVHTRPIRVPAPVVTPAQRALWISEMVGILKSDGYTVSPPRPKLLSATP